MNKKNPGQCLRHVIARIQEVRDAGGRPQIESIRITSPGYEDVVQHG